jgi:hypothetical protein
MVEEEGYFWPINREVVTDCRLSRPFVIYSDFVLGCLNHAEVDSAADVSEINANPLFWVEVSRVNT